MNRICVINVPAQKKAVVINQGHLALHKVCEKWI